MPEKKESQIVQELGGMDLDKRDDWPKQFKTLHERLEAFGEVFMPLLQELNIPIEEADTVETQ